MEKAATLDYRGGKSGKLQPVSQHPVLGFAFILESF